MLDKTILKNMEMSLLPLCIKDDGIQVEYEIIPVVDEDDTDEKKRYFSNEIEDLNKRILFNEEKLEKLNYEINRLTNNADGWDYLIAVSSGVLTGILDAFVVGELNLKEAQAFGTEKVDSFVKGTAKITSKADDFVNTFVNKIAKYFGHKPSKIKVCNNPNDLRSAVNYLQKKFEFIGDKTTSDFGGGLQHHLRDFSHHPSLLGLFCSLFTQFTGVVIGTDTMGKLMSVRVTDDVLIGKNLISKVFLGTIRWFFHLVSDVAGSSSSLYKGSLGTGIPGPIVSLAKEMSALPPFNKMKYGDKSISEWVSKIFNGTLFEERDENGKIIKDTVVQLDLRTEIGLLKQQYWPVLINECVVRTFYAIRRFVQEWKEKGVSGFSDLKKLDWKRIRPINNRTIARMMTISLGTFTAIDLGDAAIRAGVKSGGEPATFLSNFILRVNFVGIGRCAVAICTDVGMGMKCNRLHMERIQIQTEQICLKEAKLYYKQGELLIEVEKTEQSIEELCETANKAAVIYVNSMESMFNSMIVISNNLGPAIENNPTIGGMVNDIF